MFTFRLQRILELREKAEQAKAQALVAAQDLADTARHKRDALAEVHAQSRSAIEHTQTSAPRIGHLQQLGYVLQSLDARLESADEVVDAANTQVTGARELLEAAARDRRALDRLKGRHAEVWRNGESQKDRLNMDEIALARFSRTADKREADEALTRSTDNVRQSDTSTNNGSTQ